MFRFSKHSWNDLPSAIRRSFAWIWMPNLSNNSSLSIARFTCTLTRGSSTLFVRESRVSNFENWNIKQLFPQSRDLVPSSRGLQQCRWQRIRRRGIAWLLLPSSQAWSYCTGSLLALFQKDHVMYVTSIQRRTSYYDLLLNYIPIYFDETRRVGIQQIEGWNRSSLIAAISKKTKWNGDGRTTSRIPVLRRCSKN